MHAGEATRPGGGETAGLFYCDTACTLLVNDIRVMISGHRSSRHGIMVRLKRYRRLGLITVAAVLAELAAFLGMFALRNLLVEQGHPMSHRAFQIMVLVVMLTVVGVAWRILIPECKRIAQLPKE